MVWNCGIYDTNDHMPENPKKSLNIGLIVGILIVAVLGALGYFGWKTYSAPSPNAPKEETPLVDDTNMYASSTMRISVTYPKDYRVDESYVNTSVTPKKPISGVKFIIPLIMATGTNLADDTGISIEQLPRAKNCTGDIYLAANVKAVTLVEGNTSYSVATSSGAAAGNVFEEIVYAIASSSPCTAVRYFIHSGNIANYPPGAVHEFDRAALRAAFDKIRQTLLLQ